MLANILRYFQLESIKNRTEIEMNPELVLRPKEPINIRFTLRNWTNKSWIKIIQKTIVIDKKKSTWLSSFSVMCMIKNYSKNNCNW